MQNFAFVILSAYSKNPSREEARIASWRGVPSRAVTRTREFLLNRGYLSEDKGRYTVTRAGELALGEMDRKKARESGEKIHDALKTICLVLNASPDDIEGFAMLEKGMTNDSYVFYCKGKKYIYRSAGVGSEMLVDRFREYANYLALQNRGISDKLVYLDPFRGVKISEFLEDSKGIDPDNPRHLSRAVKAVRKLHHSDIAAPRDFDFRKTIDYYEEICRDSDCEFFPDYRERKAKAAELLSMAEGLKGPMCFCHIDFVPGNCLLTGDGQVTLIDWEYSGRQDPLTDIAMFCLSAAFDRERSDALLRLYLDREPDAGEEARFYAYLSVARLMWSLWGMFKTANGEVFEGYVRRMYDTDSFYDTLAREKFSLLSARQ